MSAAPAMPLAMLIPATAFFAIGVALVVWPKRAIALYVRLLKPMRGLFGSVVEWEIRLLEGRVAPILFRLFGAMVILSSFTMFFYVAAAPR